MKTSDFYYELDESLIAQTPIKRRDSSRLLVYNRQNGIAQHKVFSDITEYLNSGDVLVINETKVLPARLFGVIFQAGPEAGYFSQSRSRVSH